MRDITAFRIYAVVHASLKVSVIVAFAFVCAGLKEYFEIDTVTYLAGCYLFGYLFGRHLL